MLRIFCVCLAFILPVGSTMAQYYHSGHGPVYNTPAPHYYQQHAPRYRSAPAARRDGVVWRPHRIVIELRAYPRRHSVRPHHRYSTSGRAYRPAPAYHRHRYATGHHYSQPRPTYYYQSQPTYPAPAYIPAPRAVSAAGGTQDAACTRASNPASRRACQCAVAFGGTASISNHRQVTWRDPAGGGGILGLQQCKAGH